MSTKRSKTEATTEQEAEIDPKIQKILDEVDPLQHQIEELERKKEKQMLELELKYSKELLPLSRKRNLLAEKIPNFWVTTFEHHPLLRASLTDEDKKLLAYLKEFDVEILDVHNSYRITFKFRENEFLQTNILWKQFIFDEGGNVTPTSSEVKWKAGKDLTARNAASGKKKRPAEDIEEVESFWNFFTSPQEIPFEQELGTVLREEVWPNAIKYFKEPLDDDDDDEDGDEDVEEFDDEGAGEGEEEGAGDDE